jgi:hypothetical protein
MCDMCKNNYILFISKENKVMIKYKCTFMWCILSKKSKIIKTIYPVKKREFIKFNIIL